jgi:Tol biopolymer transport system component
MTAILNEDPPGISQVTPNLPPALQRVVHRCLEKNPEQRFQSASDLAFALEALSETSSYSSGGVATVPKRQVRLVWIIAAISGAVFVATLGLWRYLATRTPASESKKQIALRQLTGNSAENTVTSVPISPDGKYLAYGEKRGGLFVRLIDTGENRVLSSGPDLIEPISWFPDGTQFLAVKPQDHHSLWKISALTGIQHKLRDEVGSASVSPDGLHIAYSNSSWPSHELWVMGLDGQELHQVVHTDAAEYFWDFSWSPTGQQIAYIFTRRGPDAKIDTRIETQDSEGKQQPKVVLSKHGFVGNQTSETGLCWLRDGRLVYALAELPPNQNDSNLWTIRVDPASGLALGAPARLTSWFGFSVDGITAAADGRRLVFRKLHSQTNVSIARLTENGAFSPEKPQSLTTGGWENWPNTWSRDSQAIYFESNRSGKWGIYRQDISLSAPESVILGAEDFFDAALTPDGSSLLYIAGQRDLPKSWRLMRMSTGGGSPSELINGASGRHKCAFPPSNLCVVSEERDQHVVFSSLDLDRGRGDELLRVPYPGSPYDWNLSPDGRYVAYMEYNNKGLIQIYSLTGSSIRSLDTGKWTNLQEISWAADGKSLYVTAFQYPQITLLSLRLDNNIRILFQTDRTWLGSITPAPNGRMLAFSEKDFEANAAMIENF